MYQWTRNVTVLAQNTALLVTISGSAGHNAIPHHKKPAAMDLYALMTDASLLQQVASDLLDDVQLAKLKSPKPLLGEEPLNHSANVQGIIEMLEKLRSSDTPLWQLQYLFLFIVYVSDAFVKWMTTTVNSAQMQHWFDGHDTLPTFRQRFEEHLLGKFVLNSKTGKKVVAKDATPCHVFAVDEFLLAHTIVSWQ